MESNHSFDSRLHAPRSLLVHVIICIIFLEPMIVPFSATPLQRQR